MGIAPTYDKSEKLDNWTELFNEVPQIAKSLLNSAKNSSNIIENILRSVPQFLDMLKKTVPEGTFKAMLTNDQKQQLTEGALQLLHKKDGSLLAVLINPKTKEIVSQIPLKYIENPPKELNAEMANFAAQMQLAQLSEQISDLQTIVEDVLRGQELDRLATAYSCQQKFIQAQQIKNLSLKKQALLQIAFSAEDSRNLLMQSQAENIDFIRSQPEDFWGRILKGAKPEKIDSIMAQIRESLAAINSVSITEALAYQEMGEYESARQSLLYYSEYLNDTYLSVDGLVEKLDLIDPNTDNYWSVALPKISTEIKSLPCVNKEANQYV